MDRLRATRIAASAALLPALALALTGCQSGDERPSGDEGSSSESSATPIPKPDPDEYDPITVHLAAPVWSAPAGSEGERFGCDDLLVAVKTEPSGADDPADMALDFLFEDVTGEHGEPALTNAVAAAGEDLVYTGHHREGDVEVFEFSGTLAPADTCAAHRVRAQLQRTAEDAVEGEVELRVDDEPLDAVLGLEPLGEPGEPYQVPEQEEAAPEDQPAAPGESTAPGVGGQEPVEQVPAEQAPADQAPSAEAPADQVPSQQVPQQQNPGQAPAPGAPSAPAVTG